MEAIQRACDGILDGEMGSFVPGDHERYASILGRIADAIPFSRSAVFAVKHGAWLLRGKRLGLPRPGAGAATMRGLRTLAEAWRGGSLELRGVREAERAARSLCFASRRDIHADPMAAYAGIREVLSSFAGFNPHKLSYGPRGIST